MSRRDKDWAMLSASEKQREKELRPSNGQRVAYFVIGFLTVLAPIPLFALDYETNFLVLLVVSLLSAVIVSFGYHNTMFSVKTSLMVKRDGKGGSSAGVKEEQLKNTIVEATAFSVLYNNCVFLLVATGAAFFIFSAANNVVSYVVSVSSAAAFTTFLSASQLK